MPLLARMIMAPVVVDVRRGALAGLPGLLADQRISTSGRVAVAVGPTSGGGTVDLLRPVLGGADYFTVRGGTVDAALRLAAEARGGSYDAIVGIGGGRVIDATKYAAARLGLPMVAVATNLAHDGIGSPVSILDNDAGRGSYGVPAPLAVVVDLDLVRKAPVRSVRAGVGETLSNLCAVADWELAHEVRGEPVDGLASSLARTAAHAVAHHPGTVDDDGFLEVLAEALVLSGLAMVVAGSSRPCSGACHEISHALDGLAAAGAGESGAALHAADRYGGGYHGEQVGLGAAFATHLRRAAGLRSADTWEPLVAGLRRHGLPVVPDDLGLSDTAFIRAVQRAPDTRPGRYTVLEHLGLGQDALDAALREYVAVVHR